MVVFPNSTEAFARRESGGKGFNLYRCSQLGFDVPKWAIVGRSAFSTFVAETGLEERIEEVVRSLANDEVSSLDASRTIEGYFEDAVTTPDLRRFIETAYASLDTDDPIAVRSSAVDEDSLAHSFAGQLSTFLYVSGLSDVERYVKRCFASAFSERGLAYRKENELLGSDIVVAVILQEMIDPDASGVLFTCNPVTESTDEFVVSAVYGVGEGLVSGALDADNYWLDAATGAKKNAEITTKTEALRAQASGSLQKVAVDPAAHDAPVLDDAQLRLLHELGAAVSAAFGRPQDIEWAVRAGTLYLLQTRPVTTLARDVSGFPNLWDNSNIVESYGGLTSPLSFTFALNNYRLVYHQFCEVLGVPSRIIREMDHYLRNMLGCINGRVYYNLYNWYKLVGVLPGFKNNRQFMETMMGVRQELTEEINERIRPHPSWDTLRGRLRKAKIGARFLYHHWTIQRTVDSFLRNFAGHYKRFRAIDYPRLPGDRVFQHYLDMERTMIADWKAPIINDFLCMVHFGLLRKLTEKWLSDLDPNLHNDLLAGDGNLESAEPTRRLLRIAARVRDDAELRALVLDTPTDALLEVLKQSRYSELYGELRSYIDEFGFRCMNEMKLEETDLFSDPSYLFTCLKNYLANEDFDPSSFEGREQEMRERAERQVTSHLSGMRLWVYRWVLAHARKAVRNRENTRFARTRAYGIARSMFQAIGLDLAALGVIEDPRDVFFLNLEEIYGIYQGTLTSYRLTDFVAIRKRQYEQFDAAEPDPRFLTRGAVYWRNVFEEPPPEPVGEDADYDLKGLPCCPGTVEGVVKVVSSSQADLTLRGEILVTPRTDPGWVPLYPSVSGLLVERGSLLSHSAIVAREMGLPAIVAIPGLTQKLRSGMRVRMDGASGTVVVIDP